MAVNDLVSSSTMRMLAVESVFMTHSGAFLFAEEPDTQERQQFVGVHGLGDIVRCAGFEAFFAVAFHCLGRKSEDRQVPGAG